MKKPSPSIKRQLKGCDPSYRLLSWLLVATMLLISGCTLFVGEDSFGKSWQGHSLQDLQKAWGPPVQSLVKDNGDTEVRYDLFKGSCHYYFIVNREGTIVGYHYKSFRFATCKPIG